MSLEFKEEVKFWTSLNTLFTDYLLCPRLCWSGMVNKKMGIFPRDLKFIFMQIYIRLYLESIVIEAYDLVRKIKAGFP